MFKAYSRLLQTYPAATRISTTGFLFWLGDVASQSIEICETAKCPFLLDKVKKSNQYNLKRNLTFFGFGQFIAGPIFLMYYGKFQPFLFPGVGIRTIIPKLMLDQLIWAPSFTAFLFFTLTILDGKTVKEGVEKVKNNLWKTLCVNWTVWPAVMGANFSIIPLKYHIPVVNTVGFFWNTFLSYSSNK